MQPFSGTASYHVSVNHEFFDRYSEDPPEIPEEGAVMIFRCPDGNLRVGEATVADASGNQIDAPRPTPR
jgi:hypothetical protein